MKASELSGALLDYWVAKSERASVYADSEGDIWEGNRTYRPSTDWARGGPIIARDRIEITPWEDGNGAGARWFVPESPRSPRQ